MSTDNRRYHVKFLSLHLLSLLILSYLGLYLGATLSLAVPPIVALAPLAYAIYMGGRADDQLATTWMRSSLAMLPGAGAMMVLVWVIGKVIPMIGLMS
jgi:hypothetical protein